MPTPVKMPRLGESVAEGTIGGWLKQEGDYVEKDEALAEIITDKINAELPSPVAGRLARILVNVDDTVPVGAEIALIEESADVAIAPAEAAPQPAPGPTAVPVRSGVQAATPVMDTRIATTAGDGSANGRARVEEEERQRISPLARRLAQEHNIDLNNIKGTGTGGRVRKEDILAYVAQRQNAQVAPQPAAVATPATTTASVDRGTVVQPAYATTEAPVLAPPVSGPTGPVGGEDEEIVTPSRMRLSIAEHMVRSKHSTPRGRRIIRSLSRSASIWALP